MRGHGLGNIRSVQQFRDDINSQSGLDPTHRLQIVGQAEALLGGLYTHMPLKRAMHSIDPLQRLRLLKQRVTTITTTEFNAELLDVFKQLRDLHTNYTLPNTFKSQVAFLGILVEQYFESGRPKYMVSKVASHLATDPTLIPGVEITHWNGMPIALAVWRNADKEAGSNPAARFARGLETLTHRFMSTSFPPDEDWVTVTYLSDSSTVHTRINWKIFDTLHDILDGADNPSGLLHDLLVPLRYLIGIDERREQMRRAKKMLFNRNAVREARRAERYNGRVPRDTSNLRAASLVPTSRPDEITAKLVRTTSGTFGYVRLWTFHMQDRNIGAFIGEFTRLLVTVIPKEGLILDVRGNGGGYILAAEFLLQLLTPGKITPEPAQFIATSETLDFVSKVPSMAPWRRSLSQAVSTGALYSAAIPLSPDELVNSVGQLYFGPLVLITDAYCYSACDMFAAGFQDHEIGPVLGVDETTGAGGANVMTHRALAEDWTDGPLKHLPGGSDMRVSIRRVLRVGPRSGEPLEDLGVRRDYCHSMTKDDLLEGNVDLLNRAGVLLSKHTPRQFDATLTFIDDALSITLTATNVDSVDIYIDGRPTIANERISDGINNLRIARPPPGATVSLRGYSNNDLVACRKRTMENSTAQVCHHRKPNGEKT